jgi:hypothetical protein
LSNQSKLKSIPVYDVYIFIEEHPLFLPAQFLSPSTNYSGHFEAFLRAPDLDGFLSYGKGSWLISNQVINFDLHIGHDRSIDMMQY